MPSNAPTVSRGAGRAGLGRPEALEVEGQGLLPTTWAAARAEARGPARRRLGLARFPDPRQRGWNRRQGLPFLAACWCVAGPRPQRQACPAATSFPSVASASSPRYRAFVLLRPRAPSRHLGVSGRRKHGSLPGTMHARTSAPPPAGACSPAGPPPTLPLRHLCPRAREVPCWVRVHLLCPQPLTCASGSLTHLAYLTCFLLPPPPLWR
jgi:hypothetical protein